MSLKAHDRLPDRSAAPGVAPVEPGFGRRLCRFNVPLVWNYGRRLDVVFAPLTKLPRQPRGVIS